MDSITIRIGHQYPSIKKQLADQGLTPRTPHQAMLWDEWAKYMDRLFGVGVLSPEAFMESHSRFRAIIAANVEKLP